MTAEPSASRPTPDWLGGKQVLPWSWAVERLTEERNYWVVSVRRDGHPQARPVWGVWADAGLFLSVGHGGLQRTAVMKPQPAVPVTVHIDSAVDVVIVEGVIDRVAPGPNSPTYSVEADALRELIRTYNSKYAWDFDPEGGGLNFLVRPHLVYGWRSEDVATATKWAFPRIATRDAAG